MSSLLVGGNGNSLPVLRSNKSSKFGSGHCPPMRFLRFRTACVLNPYYKPWRASKRTSPGGLAGIADLTIHKINGDGMWPCKQSILESLNALVIPLITFSNVIGAQYAAEVTANENNKNRKIRFIMTFYPFRWDVCTVQRCDEASFLMQGFSLGITSSQRN
jgi:hypothetical protein